MYRKGLALILGISLTVAMIPGVTFLAQASTNNSLRLSGLDRFQTARAVAENYNDGTVQNVVLATGLGYADALSASVLAHKLNAPILLVNSTAATSQDALAYISTHLASGGGIYISGGSAVVGQDIVAKLAQIGFTNVHRLGGGNRYDTDLLIAKEIAPAKSTTVVLASGENYPDALSISSFAANKGWPVLLTPAGSLPAGIAQFIKDDQPTTVYIAGGTSVVGTAVENQIESMVPGVTVKRLAGNDRFGTAAAIAQEFAPNPSSVYFATGLGYADALAGSVLAAENDSPILLVNPSSSTLPPDISSYLTAVGQKEKPSMVSFGGTAVVPGELIANADSMINFTFNAGSGYSNSGILESSPQPTNNNWSRQSSIVGPNRPNETLTFRGENETVTTPVIGKDNTLYMGSTDWTSLTQMSLSEKEYLLAVGPNGNEKWRVQVRYPEIPVVGKSGTIYMNTTVYPSTDLNDLLAVNPDGSIKWQTNLNTVPSLASIVGESTIVIGGDEVIYVPYGDYNDPSGVIAVNSTGTIQWNFKTAPGCSITGLTTAKDGTIYATTDEFHSAPESILYAINPDGTEKWELPINTDTLTAPAIADDGTIYFGSFDKSLYAVNPNGTIKWTRTLETPINNQVAIGSDGTIYAEEMGEVLLAFNPDGTQKWQYGKVPYTNGVAEHNLYIGSPLIGANGTIYTMLTGSSLTAINPDGSYQWGALLNAGGLPREGGNPGFALGLDGTLYVNGNDLGFHAFGR